MIGEAAVLFLPPDLDCPRCGSWKAIQDAEVETIPRLRGTGMVHTPNESGMIALLDHGNVGKLNADWITRPLWRCTACGCVYDRELQDRIAEYISDTLEFA